MAKKTNKFGLKREDFASYKDYRREYDKLRSQTDQQKEYWKSEKGKLAKTKWRQLNSEICKAHTYNYRAAIKRATPPWSDTKAIRQFYKNTPKGKAVHHEYALQGENFSGLHILENLRYVTKSENSKLGNKLPKEY